MKWIALIIGIIGIVLTIKPFIRSSNWLVRLGDFPRLQVLILLLISFFIYIYQFNQVNYFDYFFTLSLIFAATYQTYCIAPFTILHPKEVQNAKDEAKEESNISLLFFNVLMENENYQDVVNLIKKVNPDVVLLAEPNQKWPDGLKDLDNFYEHKVSHILENHYGMIFYSNLDIHETELQFLIQDDIPSVHTKIRLRSGDDIAFHGVHPRPPVPEEQGRSIERDGELLLVGKAIAESNMPCIIGGDMNDAAWSYSTQLFKRISGLLDPRVGRGFYNTFHARHWLFRMSLDHVFHSKHFRLIDLQIIKNSCGSDHFPVYIKLSYEKDAEFVQAEPKARKEEKMEALKTIGIALKENKYRRLSFRNLKQKISKLKQKISRKR